MKAKKESVDNKIIKAGLGYTIGNIFIKGINFLSIPIFSRLMTAEEFGSYSVFLSYEAILFVIIGMALHSSIKSANYQFRGKINQYISSITIIYLINFFIFILVVVFFRKIFSKITGYSLFILVCLILYSTASSLITLYNEFVSLEYGYKKYMRIALANSFGNVFLSLLFVLTVLRLRKDVGRIVGTTVTTVCLTIFILIEFYRKEKPRFNLEFWKFGIKYSIPIIPHGISQVLLGQFDRIMIQKLISQTFAGIYSLAGNVKLVLTIISSSIATVWTTWFYEKMNQNKMIEIQKRSSKLVEIYSVLSVGMLALGPEIIWVLGGTAYYGARLVVFPMIMEAFILFLYNIIVPSEYYRQKTFYIMSGTLIAAIINIITNYIFIKQYGFVAAAYTTLFSYCCYFILHLIISYRLIKFYVIPIKILSKYILIVLIFGGFTSVFAENMIIRYVVCMLYTVTLLLKNIKSGSIKENIEE